LQFERVNSHSDKGGGTVLIIQHREKSQFQEIDHEVQPKAWLNAAHSLRPTEKQDQPAIHNSQTAARASKWLELE